MVNHVKGTNGESAWQALKPNIAFRVAQGRLCSLEVSIVTDCSFNGFFDLPGRESWSVSS